MTDSIVTSDANHTVLLEISRSSQTKWIKKNEENGQFNLLNARIETLTGYSLKSSENYQIVNYGLSGHFQPHHDAVERKYVRNTT